MKDFTKVVALVFITAFSITSANGGIKPNAANVQFIENKGQIVDQNYNPNQQVKYLLCRPGFNVQLRTTGFSYDTYSETQEATTSAPGNKTLSTTIGGLQYPDISRHYHRVDVELLN